MKKFSFNFLYWIILPVLGIFLYKMANNFLVAKHEFYGFAENKETQINLEHPLTVNKILVTPGLSVTKGQLLMEVTRTELNWKLEDVQQNIAELRAKDQMNRAEIEGTINKLMAQKAEKINEIQSRINAVEAEMALNDFLIKNTQTIKSEIESAEKNNPNITKITALRKELQTTAKPYEVEVAYLQQQLAKKSPMINEIDRLQKQQNFIEAEQKKLSIYAPSDGLVGNIHCKEGENISAFNTLISFYEKSPNLVVGYIHENMIVNVKIGDSVNVSSILQPQQLVGGVITGLGHRIVEIPERLRKVPTIKTFGREVLIKLPANNNFLQGEAVILNLASKQTVTSTFLGALKASSNGL